MSEKLRQFYKENFTATTEYHRMRTDEWCDIRDQVVYFLSGMRWLGYNYMSTDRKYLKEVLKPRVDKITDHIYNRGLCLATFFSTITEEEMWEIIK